ncbi:MAG: nucleoside monophosphate kinase [Holosporales bacterium]|jgi:adenylate kinase|nr:nucleoside monophosphate kinase [Holosporales bacterium]
MLGGPGSGKGTQAEYLKKENDFYVISVGDLLRAGKDEIVEGEGRAIGEIIGEGSLLPDSVITELVRTEINTINTAEKSVIFDGFPRTIGQATALTQLAKEFTKAVGKVLHFVVDEKVLFKRILGRFKCVNCGRLYNDFFCKTKVAGVCDICGCTSFEKREDDNEKALKRRLDESHAKTEVLVDYYSQYGILKTIDATGSVESIRAAVLNSLNLRNEEVA